MSLKMSKILGLVDTPEQVAKQKVAAAKRVEERKKRQEERAENQ